MMTDAEDGAAAEEPVPSLAIGTRRIGPGEPTCVIAEAGVNHNGRLSLALRMVDAAAKAGADAVKFQAFVARRLVTRSAAAAPYQRAGSQRELLERLELRPAEFAALAAACDVRGIEMILTPFSPEDVVLLVNLGLRAVKIASPDVTNVPLLRAAGRTGLPVLLSTGASSLDEVAGAVDALRAAGARDLALLHCVSSYPTPLPEANLRAMEALRRRFRLPVGYSDHTRETGTGALAVGVGACVLEKHFTLDRYLQGPDHAMSLAPDELADYVARVRGAKRGRLDEASLADAERAALGDGTKAPRPIEQDVRRVARSSVTSAMAIPAGTAIERGMLTVKRPAGGIEPAQLDALVGRLAAVDIPADTTIVPGMIEGRS